MATDPFGRWINPDKGIFGGAKLSSSTFSNVGGAVNDLFAAEGYKIKAKGNRLEAGQYDSAAGFADENAMFARASTTIKLAQQDRENLKVLGGQSADIAGAGFSASGSALDIMRDSASQGALTSQVLGAQGEIAVHGYEEQAKSYRTMAEASRLAADAQDTAGMGSTISGGIKAAAAIASVFL